MAAERAEQPRFSRVSSHFGVAAVGLGAALLLLGALAPTPLRDSLGPLRSAPSLALVLAGLALVGLARDPGERWTRKLAGAGAAACAVLGAATFALALAAPGRGSLMALPTASGLLLVGAAIRLAVRPAARAARAGELAASASLVLSTLVVLGHLYSVDELRGFGGAIASPGGAVGIVLLSLGVLASRPRFRLARVLAGRSLGAEQLRRALPALLGIPLVSGFAAALGERAGLFEPGPAIAVLTLLTLGGTLFFAAATRAASMPWLARGPGSKACSSALSRMPPSGWRTSTPRAAGCA